MATTTALDIITQALKKLVIGAVGETLDSETANDAFKTLNMLLDSWAGRNLLTSAQIQEDFNLTAFKGEYTIGLPKTGPVNADFNTEKPFNIESVFIRDSNNVDYDMDIVSRQTYDGYSDKQLSGEFSRPQVIFYEPGATQQTTQWGNIKLYPYPDNSLTYTLFLNSNKPFSEFATLFSVVTFPQVYLRAIVYNLALELAPEYGKNIHPEIFEIARESMRIIENINSRNKRVLASMDFNGKQRTFNILSGLNE